MNNKSQINGWYLVAAVLAVLGAVRELTVGAFQKAEGFLCKYRTQLEHGTKLLLEKETLTREELPTLEELQPSIAAAAKVSI